MIERIKSKFALYAAGLTAALGGLMAFGSNVHAQVTYSATDANTAISTASSGMLTFFWANLTPILEIVAVVAILVGLFAYLVGRLKRRK